MELPSWLKDAGREVKRVFKGKSKSKEDVKRRIFGVSLQEAATRDPSREVRRTPTDAPAYWMTAELKERGHVSEDTCLEETL
jgi:hypothetical protein